MLLLIPVLLATPLFCAEPFFRDIDKESKIDSTARQLRQPSIEFETIEEEVLFNKTMSSLIEVRRQKIQNLSQKIATLDRAVLLSGDLKEEYRKKQVDLDQMRHQLAGRHIELLINSSYQHMAHQDYFSTGHIFEQEALEVLKNLPPARQEVFIDGWKASMVDGGAKQDFMTYVAFLKLYGAEHALTKTKQSSLESYRDEFKSKLKRDALNPKGEGADFIYDILKDHSGFLSAPIRAKLKSIKIMEDNLNGSIEKTRELNLLQRRIIFEKEILLEFLRREGLPIKVDNVADPAFEKQLFEWLKRNKENGIQLGWPLAERGEINYPFNHQGDFSVGLKAHKTEALLASCDGSVVINEGNNIKLTCEQGKAFEIFFSGSFHPVVKDGQKVKSGEPLATLNEKKHFSLILKDPEDGMGPVDFLLFF